MKPQKKGNQVTIYKPDLREIAIPIRGVTPLICNKKADDKNPEDPGKLEKSKFVDRDAEYNDSLHPIEGGGYGFPAAGFQKSMVAACTSLGGALSKVAAKQFFRVLDDHMGLIRIEGEPKKRFDQCRIPPRTGAMVTKCRGYFPKWSAVLKIRYNAAMISPEEIVNLVFTAGFAVGVGAWSPRGDGSYGMFEPETNGSKGKK